MSAWKDIRDKSLGKEKRIEDTEVIIEWPRVRQVFAKTLANDIVPVQPMAPPSGITFL